MAIHDAYLRVTPLELAFPDPSRIGVLLADVDAESQARGVDARSLEAFVFLGAVGARVREIQGPDAPGGAVHDYARLLFHAVEMRRAGDPVFLLGLDAAREAAGATPQEGRGPDAETPENTAGPPGAEDGPAAAEWIPVAPAPAGYLQLPRHLFWSGEGGADPVPEPVDGMFWALSPDGKLRVLLVTGIRPDRPGFGVLAVPDAPWDEASAWLDAQARDDGEDFATTLPGGELEGLYSIETAGEALKLLARVFRHVDRNPAALTPGGGRSSGEGGPPPSSLTYQRIGRHG